MDLSTLSEQNSHLDSHADTCAVGSNFVPLEDLRAVTHHVSVSPFSDDYEPMHDIPICSCGTTWTDPETGESYILVFNQALFFGDRLNHSLLCPNQMRDNGLRVEEAPRQYDPTSQHGITAKRDDNDNEIFIPLQMQGVISYIPTVKPTEWELSNCAFVHMTSSNEWNPNSNRFSEDEAAAQHNSPRTNSMLSVSGDHELRLRRIQSVSSSRNLSACSVAENPAEFYKRIRCLDDGDTTTISTNSETRRLNSLHTSLYDDPIPSKPVVTPSKPKSNKRQFRFADETFEERVADRRTRFGNPSSAVLGERKGMITASELSRRFNIGRKRAEQTLNVTTQKGIRHVKNPITRRLKTQRWRNKRILPGKWFSDTAKFKVPSIMRKERVAQVFTNGRDYEEFYPCATESRCHDGLSRLINEVGIPEHLVVDGAGAQAGFRTYKTHWQKLTKAYNIRQSWIQPHCWWQNMAERSIGQIRMEMRRLTSARKSPRRLWGFLGEYVVGKRQRTASSDLSGMGKTGFERIHGYMPDITLYIIHEWYDFVWWYDQDDNTEKIGRWLGPAGDTWGGGDCFHILYKTGYVHTTNSVRALTAEDWQKRDVLRQMDETDYEIESRLGDKVKPDEATCLGEEVVPEGLFEDEVENVYQDIEGEKEDLMPDSDDSDPEAYDSYIGAQVLLPVGSDNVRGTIKRRSHDLNGNPIGRRHSSGNPILDTRKFDVEFPDGSIEAYSTNILSENIWGSVDDEGNMFTLLEEISDHRKLDTALSNDSAWYTTKSGTRKRKPTTRGWQLLLNWKDGTSSWVRLADVKESFPIELSQYARDNGIIDEPAFAWWAHHTLRKLKQIRKVSGAKTKYWMKTHKYGVRLPKSIEEAYRIDRETNTDYWSKAIAKEMKNVMITFEFSEDDRIPIGHKEISVHMVFDVKITLQRKARLVADGHKVPELSKEHTYSSVPSRDSVRIFFLIAALNNLNVLSADVQNAYLTAPIKEKYYMVAKHKDGFLKEYENRPAKIVRAMYGLPVAGASFRSYMARHLASLGYKPCRADPDVHMRKAVRKDGRRYYQYMVAYVDDLLCCGENPAAQMKMIEGKFTLKDGTVEEPKMYLGANISQVTIPNSEDPTKTRWAISSSEYTAKAVADVERELALEDYGCMMLSTTAKTPLASGYRPEIDATPELDPKEQNYYQGLVGILRWICELGRLDIIMPVSLMSRYLAQARKGHLLQIFHIFAYLKKYGKSMLVMDDTVPYFERSRFADCDWGEFYPDAKEIDPPDTPEALGESVTMTCYVDADHAGCQVTRRSHTGVIIFVNRAPILWFSKRQTTVETSTFGSEIVAMRIAVEMIEGLRYKLRMMGVPIDGPCGTKYGPTNVCGPTNVFCDNESVVKNVTRPESPIKKKHNSIAYHKAREAIASGIIRVAKEDGSTNIADIFTKRLPTETRKFLLGEFTY